VPIIAVLYILFGEAGGFSRRIEGGEMLEIG
jgi:hypothetical protein